MNIKAVKGTFISPAEQLFHLKATINFIELNNTTKLVTQTQNTTKVLQIHCDIWHETWNVLIYCKNKPLLL